MPVSKEKAEALCTPTEWKTVVNSFPPKLAELEPSVVKKNASRIGRFLTKAQAEEDSERATVLQEALDRLQAKAPEKKEDEKVAARRKKEKRARKKAQEQKEHRAEVREKLLQKAEEEKAEKEGSDQNDEAEPDDEVKETRPKGTRAKLQAAAATAKNKD